MQTRMHEESGLPETSYDKNTPLLEGFVREPGSLLSQFGEQIFGITRKQEPTTVTWVRALVQKEYPNVDPELFGRIDQRGEKNSVGEAEDIIVAGPRGGKSGTKIIVRDGYGFKLSTHFLVENEKHLGPKAENLIAENKQQQRELQWGLAVERRQLKEV